jgi:hypothetical protein
VIAAHAVPPDCGRLPPFAVFSSSNSDMVAGSRATVMSAPTRASQNGETDCFTDTAEEPLAWLRFDQVMPPSADVREAGAFAAGPSPSVEASTASWLQSSLLMSISRSTSSSLTVEAEASAAGASRSSSAAGADCASDGEGRASKAKTSNKTSNKASNKPAVSIRALASMARALSPVAKIMTPPPAAPPSQGS